MMRWMDQSKLALRTKIGRSVSCYYLPISNLIVLSHKPIFDFYAVLIWYVRCGCWLFFNCYQLAILLLLYTTNMRYTGQAPTLWDTSGLFRFFWFQFQIEREREKVGIYTLSVFHIYIYIIDLVVHKVDIYRHGATNRKDSDFAKCEAVSQSYVVFF